MTRDRLEDLRRLAELLRARDMGRLGRLAREQADLRRRVSQLSTGIEIGDDPALNAARLAHAAWAQEQRVRLNIRLAKQRAAFLEQKAQTARSVGRASALARLR